ncbi:hypothetical protein OHU34_03600 [Streptomyces sp. NBC_00080]
MIVHRVAMVGADREERVLGYQPRYWKGLVCSVAGSPWTGACWDRM